MLLRTNELVFLKDANTESSLLELVVQHKASGRKKISSWKLQNEIFSVLEKD